MGSLGGAPGTCPIASGASVSSNGNPFPAPELTSTPPCPHPQRPHTHHQAAAGNFNKGWADSCFLDLKVKEEGHHICKKRRESTESTCPLQLPFPQPGPPRGR